MTLVSITKEPVKGLTAQHLDQDFIRSAIIAELDATSLYQSHLTFLDSEKAKKVIQHIIDEEKEHISELYCLLTDLDSKQMDKMLEVDNETCIAEK